MILSRFLLIFLSLILELTNGQQPCQPPLGKPSCVCQNSQGTIDLSSLSNTDNTPRFSDIEQSDGNTQFKYSYNPCTGYQEGDYSYTCGYASVSACQIINDGESYYSLGDSNTEIMYIDEGQTPNDIFLQYDNGDDNRVTKVHLICDPNADTPTITADGDGSTPLEYNYHLTTKCACYDGCSDDPIPTTDNPGEGGNGKTSGGGIPSGYIGIILILLSIAGFVTYFVVGAIILNRKYEKQGKEMIPQKEFWLVVPYLVKDGCVFTFKPIINLVKSKTGKGGGGDDYEPLK